VQFTQELLRQHRISDATFKAVQQRLGEAGVVDLLMLIGYYHSLSHTLSALKVMPEAGSVLTNLELLAPAIRPDEQVLERNTQCLS